jgi:GtrA-like protein
MTSRLDPLASVLRRTEVRYLVVAGSVSVLSWAMVAFGLFLGWHYMIATVFSQLAPIPVAFPAYRRFVFESQGRLRGDLFRFMIVWGTGMIAPIAAAPLFVEGLRMHPVVAQIVITVVVAISSFLGHRFFSFRRASRSTGPG